MTSYAVLGYSGGKAQGNRDVPIHVQIDDMQIAEDAQMIIGHMLMQWLYAQRGDVAAKIRAEGRVTDGGARKILNSRIETRFRARPFCDFLAADGHDVLATSRSDEAHPAFLPYKWRSTGTGSLQTDRSQSRPGWTESAAGERAAGRMW